MLSNLRDRAVLALGKIIKAGIALEEIVKSLVPDESKGTVDREIENERRSLLLTLRALSGERVLAVYPSLTRDQIVKLERVARCAPALKKISILLDGFPKINVRDAQIAEGALMDPSVISKLRNHPYCVEYSASYLEDAATTLRQYLETCRGLAFRHLVRLLPITVLEHCHSQRFSSDKQREQASEYVWQSLIQELIGTPVTASFPINSQAMLVSIGSIMMIVQRKGSKPSALAHELRHMASRIESTTRRRRKAIARTEEL